MGKDRGWLNLNIASCPIGGMGFGVGYVAGIQSVQNFLKRQIYTLALERVRGYLVNKFKHTFEHFKQHYIYFHTFFYSHLYKKHSNNITQTCLPNILKKRKKFMEYILIARLAC